MAPIYSYALLQAVPDPKRGERVNIGIAVFLPDRVDVRFSDLTKLRALTRESWDEYAKEAMACISSCFESGIPPEEVMRRFSALERAIQFSNVAWFSVAHPGQYEERVNEILSALVERPRQRRAERATRINTEIAREFKKARVLAAPDETIGRRRIVRDFYIAKDEELRADFALKNGVYHIAATLDLRGADVNISQAALKAIVLDKARERYAKKVNRIGVYALIGSVGRYKPHVELLKDYADKTYNWLDTSDRRSFTRAMYNALESGPLKLK